MAEIIHPDEFQGPDFNDSRDFHPVGDLIEETLSTIEDATMDARARDLMIAGAEERVAAARKICDDLNDAQNKQGAPAPDQQLRAAREQLRQAENNYNNLLRPNQ